MNIHTKPQSQRLGVILNQHGGAASTSPAVLEASSACSALMTTDVGEVVLNRIEPNDNTRPSNINALSEQLYPYESEAPTPPATAGTCASYACSSSQLNRTHTIIDEVA